MNDQDPLAPARGCLLGVLVSPVVWLLVLTIAAALVFFIRN